MYFPAVYHIHVRLLKSGLNKEEYMTIYIDSDYKCHSSSGHGMTAVETDAFDGKCRQYIEGYRFVPAGEAWTRKDGVVFQGEMIAPWKDWRELDEAQRAYEREQYTAMEAELADARAALEILGVRADE